ncbi:hypothetical protein ES703_123453 [subsurface metagenome]
MDQADYLVASEEGAVYLSVGHPSHGECWKIPLLDFGEQLNGLEVFVDSILAEALFSQVTEKKSNVFPGVFFLVAADLLELGSHTCPLFGSVLVSPPANDIRVDKFAEPILCLHHTSSYQS